MRQVIAPLIIAAVPVTLNGEMPDELNFDKNAYYAHAALLEPPPPAEDSSGWVLLNTIETSRGQPAGSDGADYPAGLAQLVGAGWAEEDGDRYRLTYTGRHKRIA